MRDWGMGYVGGLKGAFQVGNHSTNGLTVSESFSKDG